MGPLRSREKLNLAVIGMGNRAAHMARLVCQLDPSVRVDSVLNLLPEAALREFMIRRRLPDVEHIKIFPDVESLLERAEDLDGFLIGTPCHLHAPLAVQVARAGLPLFLEKPIAIDWDQLEALRRAYAGREDTVIVSFPLRLTIHVQTALQVIRSGRLGAINQVQAVNNVPYGGVYYGQWYRSYEKTGGLWLQKATHDFDYITYMLGSHPTLISAMHSRLAYGGDMPEDLVCSRCELTETCPESPKNLSLRGDDGGTMNLARPTPNMDHACTFSSSILHQDAGSALIMYESGVHASYAQNFIARRSAGLRGATVIGYDGTLQFAWQHDTLRVIDHHRDRVDQISVKATGGHGGGDEELARNFIDVMRGREPSRSPLVDGLLSAAMCLCARESANSGAAQRIPTFDGGDGDRVGRDAPIKSPHRRGAGEIEPFDRRIS